jgi:hypothetical protein
VGGECTVDEDVKITSDFLERCEVVETLEKNRRHTMLAEYLRLVFAAHKG